MPARDPRIPFTPDASQQAVLDLPATSSALVVGAAGSGKTSTLVELVARRVLDDGLTPAQVLVLAASRHQADALRERIAARVPIVTTGPWARTAASVAFEAVAERARIEGATPPRLLSGAEHDLVIRDVLEGPEGILSTALPGTVVAVHSTISTEGRPMRARAMLTR